HPPTFNRRLRVVSEHGRIVDYDHTFGVHRKAIEAHADAVAECLDEALFRRPDIEESAESFGFRLLPKEILLAWMKKALGHTWMCLAYAFDVDAYRRRLVDGAHDPFVRMRQVVVQRLWPVEFRFSVRADRKLQLKRRNSAVF